MDLSEDDRAKAIEAFKLTLESLPFPPHPLFLLLLLHLGWCIRSQRFQRRGRPASKVPPGTLQGVEHL